jgi:hypothetical protein
MTSHSVKQNDGKEKVVSKCSTPTILSHRKRQKKIKNFSTKLCALRKINLQASSEPWIAS